MAPSIFAPLKSLLPIILLLFPVTHAIAGPATFPFNIGVLVLPTIQLLDIAPIDLYAMSTVGYLGGGNATLAPPYAIPDDQLTITYISYPGYSTTNTSADLGLRMDTDINDPAVAPGNLSLLMIPGPPPGMRPEEEALEFVRKHVDAGTDIATICSGIWVAAFAGVLDGREATLTVRTGALVDALEGQFPDVKWMDRRYGVDRSGPADLWTAAGITYGMDMVGAYMHEKFGEVSAQVLDQANVDVRAAEYYNRNT